MIFRSRLDQPAVQGPQGRDHSCIFRLEEILNHRHIGRGPVELLPIRGNDPTGVDVDEEGKVGIFAQDSKKGDELQSATLVVMENDWQGGEFSDLEVEFFVEFAAESFLWRLTRLDLASGKFPSERKGLFGWALSGEDPAGGSAKDGADDGERITGHESSKER